MANNRPRARVKNITGGSKGVKRRGSGLGTGPVGGGRPTGGGSGYSGGGTTRASGGKSPLFLIIIVVVLLLGGGGGSGAEVGCLDQYAVSLPYVDHMYLKVAPADLAAAFLFLPRKYNSKCLRHKICDAKHT